jgi:hypothetical protein
MPPRGTRPLHSTRCDGRITIYESTEGRERVVADRLGGTSMPGFGLV